MESHEERVVKSRVCHCLHFYVLRKRREWAKQFAGVKSNHIHRTKHADKTPLPGIQRENTLERDVDTQLSSLVKNRSMIDTDSDTRPLQPSEGQTQAVTGTLGLFMEADISFLFCSFLFCCCCCCVYSECVCVSVCIPMSKTLVGVSFLLHHVGPGDGTSVIRLGSLVSYSSK